MNKKVLFIPLLLILGLLIAGPVAAQSTETATAVLLVPEGQLTVGDPIELRLTVTHPADSHAIMPELEGEWGSFLVQNQSAPVTEANADGTETTTQIIDARLFAPGSFTTPPITVNLTDSAGQVSELLAGTAAVSIASVLVEGDSDLRDIKPQAEMPYVNILLWGLVALLAALVAGIVILLVRRSRARRALAAVDNRLPHEVALDELDRIEGLQLPDVSLFKEHYTLVSDTLRIYMEKRIGVPMMERTTFEIQTGLKQTELEPSVTGHFLSLLDVSDLVKFSKFTPEAVSAYGIVTSARQIVQATIPVIEDEEETGTGSNLAEPNRQLAVNDRPSNPQISVNGKFHQTEVGA